LQAQRGDHVAASIADQLTGPLFLAARGRTGKLGIRAMSRHDVLRMIKRHCRRIGPPHAICCHTLRATGKRDCLPTTWPLNQTCYPLSRKINLCAVFVAI
jgi:hypothetical protein